MTYGPYKATVVNLHDGDTVFVEIVLDRTGKVKADIDLGFGLHRTPRGHELPRQSVRLFGCNAPELATPAGRDALAYLETILHVGDTVTLVSHNWDKYGGRIDGQVTLPDGRDLSQAMIDAGHAAAWNGQGAKPVPAPTG